MLTVQNKITYTSRKNDSSKKQVVFRSNYTVVKDIFGREKTPNATCFFRGDLDWKGLCKLILKTFQKSEKVNIFCVPCSDGTEPTSLLLKLMQFKKFRKNIDKYKPIKSYDIDDKQLEIAKSGKIPLINNFFVNICDTFAIWKNTKFGFANKWYEIKDGKLTLKPNLQDCVQYEKKDIETVVNDLPKDEKIVLLARNIFPYLHDFKIDTIFKQLSKIKEGSLFVIGNYDKKELPQFEDYVQSFGFKKTKVENCFVKT